MKIVSTIMAVIIEHNIIICWNFVKTLIWRSACFDLISDLTLKSPFLRTMATHLLSPLTVETFLWSRIRSLALGDEYILSASLVLISITFIWLLQPPFYFILFYLRLVNTTTKLVIISQRICESWNPLCIRPLNFIILKTRKQTRACPSWISYGLFQPRTNQVPGLLQLVLTWPWHHHRIIYGAILRLRWWNRS